MASRGFEKVGPVISCFKTLLLAYCLIFWATGAILLAVGLWSCFLLGPYLALMADTSTKAPYVLIATGTAVILFGLFGCLATCRGSVWMLRVYTVFLLLVFLAELIAGISGFIFRHEMKGSFRSSFQEAVLQYNSQDQRSLAVDNVQRSLRCCGVFNHTSWFSSSSSTGVPASCCVSFSDCGPEDLRSPATAPGKVHAQGCYSLVTSFIETNVGIVAGVTFGVAFSQLVGILLACCLSRFISANQYEMV